MTSRPRPDLVPTSSQGNFAELWAETGPPHESTSSPRPPHIGGRGRGRGGNLVPTSSLTFTFKPSTCQKCHTATLHGIADGITRHLEPRALTDHGEYRALAAGLRTYNLHPDRTAMPRTISHIAAPDRHPRLAQHACGQQYGDQALPGPRPRPADHDDPPF